MDFYQEKYKLLDLSKVNENSIYRPPAQRSFVPQQSLQIDELKVVNPEIVKQYGLGSVEQLQQKMQNLGNLEQMMLEHQLKNQRNNGMAQDPRLTQQQVHQFRRLHKAATTVQKYIRGHMSRTKTFKSMQPLLFFKKVHRVVTVQDLVNGMKSAFI